MHIYVTTCLPEWTDYNGHMNDALYGRVFSDAIDALMIAVGVDAAYRDTRQATLYTVEDHRWYEREVHAGAAIQVETHVLDLDAKRIHLWQALKVGQTRCAVAETMLMHIFQAGEVPKSAPMPEIVQDALRTHLHGEDVTPRASTIGIRRKSPS